VRLNGVRCEHAAFTARELPGEMAVAVTFDPALWSVGEESGVLVFTTSTGQPICRVPLAVLGEADTSAVDSQATARRSVEEGRKSTITGGVP
jgi:hypothetical protein